jgi:oligopeptide transport system substrate-binding protein
MTSRKILAAVLTGLFITSTFCLGGCASKDTSTKPKDETKIKMDADQTINLVGYDFKTLDPALASDVETFTTLTAVYEGLVDEVMKDGKVTTELAGAKSITPNADNTVYTIKLRDDAKWSDGKAVTAQDYVFGWKRQADPAMAADYISFLNEIGIKGADELLAAIDKEQKDKYPELLNNLGIKAVDDKTLEVTLQKPTAYFISSLAFKGLVPGREDLAKAQGDKYGSDYKTMVYNGPYVISDYQKGSKIVFKKNDTYWNKKAVNITTANCFIVEEPQTIVKMFEGKELDMCNVSGDDVAKLKKEAESGAFAYEPGMDVSSFYLYLNNNRPVLKNVKVRLAMSLAFNRQQFLDVVFKRNVPSWGMVPTGICAGSKDYRKEVPEPLKSVKDDPKTLMTEGLKEVGITDPSKVTLVLLNSKANSIRQASSEYIQKFLKDTFGINSKIVYSVDSPAYFTERTKGNFDICIGGWGADYNDVNSFFACFLSNSSNNNGKYNNPEYDKLVKDASGETDDAKRLEMYKTAEELLIVKDAGVIPTYYQDIHTFRQNYVKNLYIPKFSGRYDFTRAYISGK